MKTEDILTVEESGENRINLVRDRLFWQAWNKSAIVKSKPKLPDIAEQKTSSPLLPAYKTAYDLCLHIHRATVKMPREFRYELGARVRDYATDVAEMLHTMANGVKNTPPIESCASIIHKLRIDIRVLKDLHQIGIEQWGFLKNAPNRATGEQTGTPMRFSYGASHWKHKKLPQMFRPCRAATTITTMATSTMPATTATGGAPARTTTTTPTTGT